MWKYDTEEQRKEAIKRDHQKFREENPDKVYKWKREASWRKQGINLTFETFLEMINIQGNRCKICGKLIEGKGHSAIPDHDHLTGEVRGILCKKCNNLLGMAGDSTLILEAAIEYLKSA